VLSPLWNVIASRSCLRNYVTSSAIRSKRRRVAFTRRQCEINARTLWPQINPISNNALPPLQ
jgi:hypothetical protein